MGNDTREEIRLATIETAGVSASDYLSVTDAAEATRTHPNTVWGWIRTGKLPAVRVAGRLVRIRRADLDALFTDYQESAEQTWVQKKLGVR